MFQNLQGGFLNNPQGGGGGGPSASARMAMDSTFITFGNVQECCTFLDSLYQQSPSPTILSQLAQVRIGRDLWHADSSGQLAVLYLQTAAKHLIVAAALGPEGSATASIATAGATTNTRRGGASTSLTTSSPIPIIMELIGIAATHCERSSIASTGILLAMDHLLLTTPNSAYILSPTLVEFLQVSLLAGQYRFVRGKMLQPTIWPLPSSGSSVGGDMSTTTTTTVEHVLRYYHLRGMIHLACQEYGLAIRSFWTCLSVPMDVVSMIAIDAWKKMVLTQVIYQSNSAGFAATANNNNNKLQYDNLIALPPGISPAVSRLLLTSSTTATTSKSSSSAAPTAASSTAPEVALPEAEMSDDVGPGGPPPPPPEATLPQQQQQQYYGIPVYHQLLHAICSSSCATMTTTQSQSVFQQIATQYQSQWQMDSTTGLVEQCAEALRHVHLRQMARQYSVVPLTFIAKQLKLADNDEDMIKSLLESVEHLHVQYHSENNTIMVEWKVMVTPSSTKVQSNLKELMTLTTRIRSLDCTFTTNHNLQMSSSSTGGGKEQGASGGSSSSKRNPIGVEDF